MRTGPSAPRGYSNASALLRRLGLRYGIGLGVFLVVVVIVVVARVTSGSTGSLVQSGTDNGLLPSSSPVPDDGVVGVPSPAPPTTSPGSATPQAVATSFAAAWLHHDGTAAVWRASLQPLSTQRLDGELAEADPATVPAERTTGPVTLTDHATSFVEAHVPTDSGTLILSLLATQGRWQVDAIDWDPA